MDRDITIRFYEVRATNPHGTQLDGVMRSLAAAAKRDRERELSEGITLRLEHLEEHDGLLLGDMTRVQTENLPGHVTDNDNGPLPVDEIGHPAAFCYDPETQCLALQFDLKIGVGRVLNYFHQFAHGNGFGSLPVLQPDALERFARETPKRLTIKVARRRNFENVEGNITDIEELVDRMGAWFDAPSVEITVGCRATDGGLNKERVLDTIQRWLGFRDEIEGINKIAGATIETDEAFNFIKFLLKEHDTIELPANDPADGRTRRLHHVRQKFAQHRAYLRETAGVA